MRTAVSVLAVLADELWAHERCTNGLLITRSDALGFASRRRRHEQLAHKDTRHNFDILLAVRHRRDSTKKRPRRQDFDFSHYERAPKNAGRGTLRAAAGLRFRETPWSHGAAHRRVRVTPRTCQFPALKRPSSEVRTTTQATYNKIEKPILTPSAPTTRRRTPPPRDTPRPRTRRGSSSKRRRARPAITR